MGPSLLILALGGAFAAPDRSNDNVAYHLIDFGALGVPLGLLGVPLRVLWGGLGVLWGVLGVLGVCFWLLRAALAVVCGLCLLLIVLLLSNSLSLSLTFHIA